MAEIQITEENFENEVLKSDLPVLLDFSADWCGPCKMMEPVLGDLAKEYEGKWKIGKCNVDENPNLAGKYEVQSIPTLFFFKDGQVEDKVIGFQSKESLKSKLD